MFGKPKRAKPRNRKEAKAVDKALKAKYPQMYRSGWGKPISADERRLRVGGLTAADIRRLEGKK